MQGDDANAYIREYAPDQSQVGRLFLKTFLRHPLLILRTLLKRPGLDERLAEYAPRVSYGRTDHPLDDHGPFTSFLTAIPKLLFRASRSILSVALQAQQDNRFLFRARAYNIFKLFRPDEFYHHVYNVTDSTPFRPCTLVVEFLRNDVYRLRLVQGTEVPDNATPMVCNDIRDHGCSVDLNEDAKCYTLATSALKLRIHKADFRIEVFDATGRKLTQTGGRTDNGFGVAYDAYPLGFVRDRRHKQWYATESFELTHGEAVYGFGEQFGPLNKVGQTLRLWITEGVGNTTGRVYKSVPFFVSSRGYGAFFNHTHPMTFWVGSKEFSKTEVAVEDQHLDYFFFAGSVRDVLNNYTALTGRSAMAPRFSFGTWVTRMSYTSQREVLDVARRLRDERFPADVVHIDDAWFKETWRCDWKFDQKRFPDPAAMCRDLHDLGFRVSIWQQPYILKETDLWGEARSRGYLASTPVPFVFAGRYECAPIDFTNPEARRWYQERLLRPLFELGVDVIKTDFGEGLEPGMRFQGGDGYSLHNVYPLLYVDAAYEITKKFHGDQAMVWGRSAYAGSQRYPVYWSGDNGATFGSMRCSLRGGLSFGLSGFSFWSQDTGGFVGEPTDELYVRWTQLSVFQSHFRYHGCYPFREPWQFGASAQETVRRWLELRYRLIPYLYGESLGCIEKGLPLLRHLVVDYQSDPTVHAIEDQFLCGDRLLVAPILNEEKERSLYLPPGEWYDFFSHEHFEGGQWITRSCSMEEIPVYVRAGTVVPLGPVAASTARFPEHPEFDLHVFLNANGKANYRLRQADADCDIDATRANGSISVDTSRPMKIASTRFFAVDGELAGEQA